MPETGFHYRPSWPLGCFVKTIWYWEGFAQPHAFERLMPDGMLSLVVNLEEDLVRVYDPFDQSKYSRLTGAAFMGAHRHFFVIDTAGQKHVIGAQFHAGGAHPFLGIPADELENLHVSLEDIWGTGARKLRGRILAAGSPLERCRVLERELLARAAGRLEVRSEVRFAVEAFNEGSSSVAGVIQATGLSARRFAELFRTAVGLTPKAYARVRRFQSAMQAINASSQSDAGPDWAEIALSCGYFDQAHFNHDFREFSGSTPSNYFATERRHMNHVPID